MRSKYHHIARYSILAFLAFINTVSAFKILMVPLPRKSHIFSMLAIADGLNSRGHQVTFVVGENMPLYGVPHVNTGQPSDSVVVERYTDNIKDYDAQFENSTLMMLEGTLSLVDIMWFVRDYIDEFCHTIFLKNEPFMKRLEEARYDLVVIDSNAVAKCLNLVPHRLHLPFVTYTDVSDPLVMRVPWLPSFVPTEVTTNSDRMSFVQRVKNMANMAALSLQVVPILHDFPTDVLDIYRRAYGEFSSFDEIASRSLLWLIPKDHIVDFAKPTMPHVVNVGGLTIKQSTDELPADFRAFIDGAPNGTILVSFGTIASKFPDHITRNLLEAFHKLEGDGIRFIFRLKTSTLGSHVNISSNVMIRGWIPQNDLLADAAVRLFITHCGNNGLYEAVYHGKPMIGFPIFSDQPYNAHRMKNKGFGIPMEIRTFQPDELVANIRRVLFEDSFKDRLAKASAILRSNPDGRSPVERAAYWIEHVCRFGGDHLRSGGQDLPLYAYVMIDLALFLGIITTIAVWSIWKMFQWIGRHCFTKGDKKNVQKK